MWRSLADSVAPPSISGVAYRHMIVRVHFLFFFLIILIRVNHPQRWRAKFISNLNRVSLKRVIGYIKFDRLGERERESRLMCVALTAAAATADWARVISGRPGVVDVVRRPKRNKERERERMRKEGEDASGGDGNGADFRLFSCQVATLRDNDERERKQKTIARTHTAQSAPISIKVESICQRVFLTQ